MDHHPLLLAAVAVVGFAAGFINTLAGSGSLLMLPILILLGFIQISVGLFLLAGLVLGAGHNLLGASALKNFIVLVLSVAALVVFVLNDQVHWTFGLLLGAGQAAGGWVAARFAVERGATFVRSVVVVVAVLSALALFAAA